jgi:hypothetical protein
MKSEIKALDALILQIIIVRNIHKFIDMEIVDPTIIFYDNGS